MVLLLMVTVSCKNDSDPNSDPDSGTETGDTTSVYQAPSYADDTAPSVAGMTVHYGIWTMFMIRLLLMIMVTYYMYPTDASYGNVYEASSGHGVLRIWLTGSFWGCQ